MSTERIMGLVTTYLVPFLTNLITAILVFYIGRWVARKIKQTFYKMTEGKIDPSLQKFVVSLAYGLMLAIVIIAALQRLGVPTTSAVAIIGAAGLAIGFALQGSLANFASGVMIIFFRPYRIGDLVDLAGNIGVVEGIEIFNTTVVTPDNKTIIIPNGKVTDSVIVNISGKGSIRVDIEVGVSYTDDLNKAKQVIEAVFAADSRILKDPAPAVAVSNLGDSSVELVVRPWCAAADYWDVRFDTIQAVKESLDKAGISIPFPQQDVYVKEVARAA